MAVIDKLADEAPDETEKPRDIDSSSDESLMYYSLANIASDELKALKGQKSDKVKPPRVLLDEEQELYEAMHDQYISSGYSTISSGSENEFLAQEVQIQDDQILKRQQEIHQE